MAAVADKALALLPALCFYGHMLKDPSTQPFELEMATLDELVPQNHLLCKIVASLDFSFIRDQDAISIALITVIPPSILSCFLKPSLSVTCLVSAVNGS
tara:strand:+ start:918 stop:1214 length:297 start_codon:yes stop_codon:yes gene_type:complete